MLEMDSGKEMILIMFVLLYLFEARYVDVNTLVETSRDSIVRLQVTVHNTLFLVL